MAVLYQMKLDQSIVDCGMSYVFQLRSGHYFLIDGGYFTPGEAERLYRFLCAHTTEKPVIDGWFFSHAHQDHIGVFLDMMETHRNDVVIRKLIYNFQSLELPETSEGWQIVRNDLQTIKRFYEVVKEKCADIPVITPHTGETWQEDELLIDVLYTHEDLDVPSTFNDHSTVLRIETDGWSILFLGDVYQHGSRIMLAHCPRKLQCDIVQVSHHGFAGATKELYQATNAHIALWPAMKACMEANRHREANDYLLNHSTVEQHWVGEDGSVKISFPERSVKTGTQIATAPVERIAEC